MPYTKQKKTEKSEPPKTILSYLSKHKLIVFKHAICCCCTSTVSQYLSVTFPLGTQPMFIELIFFVFCFNILFQNFALYARLLLLLLL